MDRYVDSGAALAQLVSAFRREPVVAVDTEAASFHKHRDRIYLIQLSTGAETAIVDPLAVTDLVPLGALLGDGAVEKVFHDADYDLRVFDRDYQFHATKVFDTRVAAQLAGERAIGLAALLEKYLGVRLSKEHQKADWSRRPLSPEQLEYAAADARHLPALREALRARLVELVRLDWAGEEFQRLESLRWTATSDGPDAYLRVKGAKALTGRQLAALRELYAWREEVAARQDRAAFRVIGNDALLAISRALPTTRAALTQTEGVPPSLASRHEAALLECVTRALASDEAQLPRIERRLWAPRDPAFEARVERLKDARNRAATELGLDAGVLCPRSTLEAVARAQPRDRAGLALVAELRRWQMAAVGDALLAVMT